MLEIDSDRKRLAAVYLCYKFLFLFASGLFWQGARWSVFVVQVVENTSEAEDAVQIIGS